MGKPSRKSRAHSAHVWQTWGITSICCPSVWISSPCAAVPHASVLAFSGATPTHLLHAGYPLCTITSARASGAVCGIGGTFTFPWAVGTLSASVHSPGRYKYDRGGYQDANGVIIDQNIKDGKILLGGRMRSALPGPPALHARKVDTYIPSNVMEMTHQPAKRPESSRGKERPCQGRYRHTYVTVTWAPLLQVAQEEYLVPLSKDSKLLPIYLFALICIPRLALKARSDLHNLWMHVCMYESRVRTGGDTG